MISRVNNGSPLFTLGDFINVCKLLYAVILKDNISLTCVLSSMHVVVACALPCYMLEGYSHQALSEGRSVLMYVSYRKVFNQLKSYMFDRK